MYIKDLTYDFKWPCRTYTEGHGMGEEFTIDARTGEVSKPQGWHRID